MTDFLAIQLFVKDGNPRGAWEIVDEHVRYYYRDKARAMESEVWKREGAFSLGEVASSHKPSPPTQPPATPSHGLKPQEALPESETRHP